jgi:hypothetical protein
MVIAAKREKHFRKGVFMCISFFYLVKALPPPEMDWEGRSLP